MRITLITCLPDGRAPNAEQEILRASPRQVKARGMGEMAHPINPSFVLSKALARGASGATFSACVKRQRKSAIIFSSIVTFSARY